MRDKILDELCDLDTKEKYLNRCLDINKFDKSKRTIWFRELKDIKKKKEKLRFQLRLEKEMRKNAKSRQDI